LSKEAFNSTVQKGKCVIHEFFLLVEPRQFLESTDKT